MSKARKRLNYLGIFILLMALASLQTSIMSMILLLIGGVTIFPNVREKILEIKPELHEKIPLLVSILFIIIGFASWSLIGKAKEEKEKSTVVPKPTINKTPEQIEKEKVKAESDAILAKAQLEYELAEYSKPFTENSHPSSYEKWGNSGMDEINKVLPEIIEYVHKNAKDCNKISYVGVYDKMRTISDPTLFIDCKNTNRYIVSKSDVDNNRLLMSQSQKLGDPKTFVNPCADAVRSRLKFPNTFNRSVFDTTYRKGSVHGNVIVTMPFKYKNGFDMELKRTAKCTFTPDNQVEVIFLN